MEAKAMIFYFTATGNSKFVAEKIAAATGSAATGEAATNAAVTGDAVINMATCVQNEEYSFELREDEKLGIIVPIYFYGIPIIAAEFLNKLKITGAREFYAYAVLNCGGATGDAGRFIISNSAVRISAIFGIKTVDNYVPMYKTASETKINEQLDNAEKEIEQIARRINNREIGLFNPAAGFLPGLMTFLFYSRYIKGRKTNKFTVSNKCNGCGLCREICPRRIIKLKNNKPVWSAPACELCLGCLHRCPTAAIDYGNTADRGRYLNPRVRW